MIDLAVPVSGRLGLGKPHVVPEYSSGHAGSELAAIRGAEQPGRHKP